MRGLYLVTDRGLCGGRALEEVVARAVAGGAACVQLREKDLSTRAFVELARSLKALLAPLGVPLLINDRMDVALAAGADGAHVGQGDMPCERVRQFLGPRAIIGLSVETWADVERAQDQDVDYLGVSPVFPTPTKTDTKAAWGLAGVARIRAFSRHPLVAIGGLNAANAAQAVLAGADGIAVVSAICASPDPEAAARELDARIQAALRAGRIALTPHPRDLE
jgi:thiamine-phosphate pyrophosphorylase